ncbi:DsbA family protein [Patescibacteria group bacterium]|nr:DsbA family protein [Patescibacteria group bacterium]
MVNKTEKFFGVTIIILAGLLAGSIYTKGFGSVGDKLFNRNISYDEAKEKVIAYAVANFNIPQDDISVSEVKEENGLYKLSLKVQGQDAESYLTADGKLFFPYAYDIQESQVAGTETEASSSTPQDIPKSANPEVMLFTMSFCPYGNVAEDAIKPVAEALGNVVEIEPHYVIYSDYATGYPDYCLDEANQLCSMHGINELNQNIRESCVYELSKAKFWDFLFQINQQCSVNNVETCWEGVAKSQGLDTTAISSCAQNKGEQFSQADKSLNEEYAISGSPVLLINGVIYEGARTPEDYKNAICSAFITRPQECEAQLENNAQAAPAGSCE